VGGILPGFAARFVAVTRFAGKPRATVDFPGFSREQWPFVRPVTEPNASPRRYISEPLLFKNRGLGQQWLDYPGAICTWAVGLAGDISQAIVKYFLYDAWPN